MAFKLNKVYLDGASNFAQSLTPWLESKNVSIEKLVDSDDINELIQGAVILHVDHNLDKSVSEWRTLFETFNIPVHKIDLNGTMNVAVSHFELFVERESCKNLAIIASEDIISNEKLEIFKEKLN